MNIALILFVGGLVVITLIYFLSRPREDSSASALQVDLENVLSQVPAASINDGLLISESAGKLVYANEPARRWANMNGDVPHLERYARLAEPSDNFLRLFASEGQTSFQLGTRWVEASSHRIPYGENPRTVVVMRELSATSNNADSLDMNLAMSLINEIGETVDASMGVEQVLPALLTIIMRSLPSDAGEICLWDEERQVLHQRGWVGDSAYLIALSEAGGRYNLGEGISGWMAKHLKPVFLDSLDDLSGVQPKFIEHNPYESFIGVPLRLGERFIGTLELAHEKPNHYRRADLSLLQAVGKPVANMIYNTIIYSQQVKRIDDLASLQQVVGRQQSEDADHVKPVYTALTERIARLLSADMCGILLYDTERQRLLAEPPFHGLPEALVRSLSIPLPKDSPQHDIWMNQSYWVSNDVPDEPLVEALGLAPLVEVSGITNTAWMPLQISDQRIGAIAVSNKRTEGGFTPRDIQNLTVLAAQAAVVIENLRLYQRERRMDTELVGLQEITNAIGALSHETEFYGEITERIAKQLEIEMCGILLYDEERKQLVNQPPFYGIRDDTIADYVIDLQPGTVMEQLWDEDRYWYSNRVQIDSLVYEAGLDQLAEHIGVEKTLIVVLAASGRKLGVVQASNKISGADFNESDARLLLIFATQAAAIIENARLFREAQRSADQAQSLRRVAELAGNVSTEQESFAPILAEIAEVMKSEAVFVNVLNQQTGSLVTYPRWVHGMELVEPVVQDIYHPDFKYSPVQSHQPYISNDVFNDPRTLETYKQIAQRLHLKNAILVPLIFGERTLGELGIANRYDGPYLQEDLEVMQVVAAQIASALDRLLMFEATGENLNRRMEELDAISLVSNELTVTLNFDRILAVIQEQAVKATRADGSTVALLRASDEWDDVGAPEMSRRLQHEHELPQLVDIELEAVVRGSDNVLITDYEFSTFDPGLSNVCSAIAASIFYGNQVVGVIHLYHQQANYFDDRAAAFLATLASKASLGYGNAIRYEEQVERSDRLRRRVEQLNRIFELGHMFQSNADPVTIVEGVAYSVQQSVGYDTIVMCMYDEHAEVFRRVAHAGLPLDVFDKSKSNVISRQSVNTLLREEYQISESYFFPVEKVGQWYVENISALSTDFDGKRTMDGGGKNMWHDGDMLLVTMRGADGNPIGLMSLDRPFSGQRPDKGTVEVLEIFAHQAANTIENTRLYISSVESAEQEAQLNEVLEAVSSTLDITEVVQAVAEGARQMLDFSRMTLAVADVDNQGFELTRARIRLDETIDVSKDQRVSLGNSAIQRTYAEGEDYLYTVGDEDVDFYDDLMRWRENGEQTSLVLPLMTGGKIFGAVHFGSNTKNVQQFVDNRSLLRRMAQMVASAVQNARLFDQAVNLQVLNRSVVDSIQQGIVVLDRSGHIISSNSFMQERYGWDHHETIRGFDLFDYRPRMAEFLTEDLRSVLEEGEPKEHINETVLDGEGDEVMSNFYLYPLRYDETIGGAVLLVEDVSERVRLERRIQARAMQLASLTEVSTRITSSLERADVVTLALEEMKRLIPYDTMSLWRRNGSYLVLEGSGGEAEIIPTKGDVRYLFSEYPVMQRVVENQRPVSVGTVDEIEAALPIHEDFESWLGVPLVNQGHVVGMMMLSHSTPNFYSNDVDQNIAMAFASQVAIAEANADLFEQTFDRTNELGTLLEAATATSMTTDLNSVYKTIVELMFSALEMDDCAIMLWDEVDHELEVQVDMNRDGDLSRIMAPGTKFNLSDYPAKLRALREREVVVIMASDDATPYQEEVTELRDNHDNARMLVPLVVRERSIGLIQLEQTGEEGGITQQEVRLSQALGTQVAVAIENAQLSSEAASHFEESMLINDLSRAISSTLELEDMIEVVRKQVPKVVKANELYVALYDSDTEMISFPLSVQHEGHQEIPPRPLGNDEVSFIIKHRRPLSLGADYFSPEELRKSLGIENGEGDIKSYMGVPLIAGDEIYGVLAVRDTVRTRAFTVNEQRVLNIIGPQLGASIQNARLFTQISNFAADLNEQVAARTHELEEERDRIDTLYQITSELARTLDMDRLMPRALGMVAKAVSAQDGVIMQLDPFTDELYSRAVLNPHSLQENPDGGEHAYHPAERIARWLIDEDEHVEIVEELVGQPYWDENAPGAAEWRSALVVLLETNEELHGVMVLLSREPNAFTESHLRLMVAAANQVASSINNAELYKLIRDQAERLGSLLRTEQEEAEKNKAILEGIADGVVLADALGEIVLFNNAAERILRVPRDQAMGMPLSQVTGVQLGVDDTWANTLQERFADMQGVGLGEFIDEQIEMGDRVVSVHLSPVYTGDKFLGTVSVFRDVTREVEADRSKSKFVANVSHEFRTPLTPIKGYIDMVLMGATGEVNDMQRNVLDTAKRNVDRLASLVDDVLRISELDRGGESLALEEVDINAVITQTVETALSRDRHTKKDFNIIFEPNLDLPILQADKKKLLQVLYNLVDNAFNYTLAGGTIEIVAEADPQKKKMHVSVRDTGVGIDEEFRDKIWERFQRNEDVVLALEVAGTGLGLPIVKELIEMHHGDVWFESEVEVGTTFHFTLPLKQLEIRPTVLGGTSNSRSN